MDYIEVSAKTVEDAITEACQLLTVTSDRLDYEVIQNGSSGFLGLNVKPAIIRAKVKDTKADEAVVEDKVEVVFDKKEEVADNKSDTKNVSNSEHVDFPAMAKEFLASVFEAMNMEVNVDAKFDSKESVLEVELSGAEMGVLIGKRGQTLDSLQYLISLVVNKESDNYIHVKVDTENYRERRKATLENLAKNIAFKVRKSRQSVALEPMNPYERRIIHSALQNDRYVTTHSEGEEPFRRVIITLKK